MSDAVTIDAPAAAAAPWTSTALREAFSYGNVQAFEAALLLVPRYKRRYLLQEYAFRYLDTTLLCIISLQHGRWACCRHILSAWPERFVTPQILEQVVTRIMNAEGWKAHRREPMTPEEEATVRYLARVVFDESRHALQSTTTLDYPTNHQIITGNKPDDYTTLALMSTIMRDSPSFNAGTRRQLERTGGKTHGMLRGQDALLHELEAALWPSEVEEEITEKRRMLHVDQQRRQLGPDELQMLRGGQQSYLALFYSRHELGADNGDLVSYMRWQPLLDRLAEIAHDPIVLRLGSGQLNLIMQKIVEPSFLNINARFEPRINRFSTGNDDAIQDYKYPLFRQMVHEAVRFALRHQEAAKAQEMVQAMQNTLSLMAPVLLPAVEAVRQERMATRREQSRAEREEEQEGLVAAAAAAAATTRKSKHPHS